MWLTDAPTAEETLGPAPTQRAISEHVIKLRANLTKSGVTVPKSGKKSTTATPSGSAKKTAPQTPASKSKGHATMTGSRKRKVVDEDEEEEAMATPTTSRSGSVAVGASAFSPTPSRKTLHRSSKTPEKRQKVNDIIKEDMEGGGDGNDSEADDNFIDDAI